LTPAFLAARVVSGNALVLVVAIREMLEARMR
jgi:hypothetical protein